MMFLPINLTCQRVDIYHELHHPLIRWVTVSPDENQNELKHFFQRADT